ncbi:MAG: hypothetical protein AAF495_29100 [Pseudomonadota bacterium]
MSLPKSLRFSLAFGLLLTGLGAGPAVGQGTTQPPDFSNVEDVLQGRRLILPVQDLVIGSSAEGRATILETDKSTVTREVAVDTGGTPIAIGSGRVFDLENDVIITMVRLSGSIAGINLRDAVGQRSLSVDTKLAICTAAQQSGCNPNLVVTGDLTGDGFDEIVLSYAGGGLQVASAVDVSDFEKGLVFGPLFQGEVVVQPQAMAVANFTGSDGRAIAAFDQPDFEVYQLRPVSSPNDTPSLELIRVSTVPFNPFPNGIIRAQLSAGQFDSNTKDRELALTLIDPNNDAVNMYFVQMSDTLIPSISNAQPVGVTADIISQTAGRLDWFSDQDQLVMTLDRSGANGQVSVVQLINNGLFIFPASHAVFFPNCGSGRQSQVYDVALGDFDFDLADPASTPPDLEIGVLAGCEGLGFQQLQWQIFKSDAQNEFAISFVSEGFQGETFPSATPVLSAIVASDTQGRSLLLGPATKVVLNDHSQPRIVMGAPPMHIDFIQNPIDPGQPSTAFGKINMTAFPSTDDNTDRGMNSEFDLAASSSVQNSSTQTTSYSYTTGTAVDANIGLGIPDIASLGASMTSIAETTHAGFVQNKFGSYDSFAYDIQTITGFGDVVWFNTKRFNLWVYRVLGHFACPADNTSCNSKLPLNIVFSGPDKIINHPHTPSAQIEWHQPHHEVGNILSYPQTLDQLEATLGPDGALQQFFETDFLTGTNDDTQTLEWSSGQTSAQSTGSAKIHSQRTSETVGGGGDYFLIGGTSATFEENRSRGISTLEDTVETTASTNGFMISVPSFNLGEDYSYPFDGFILGDSESESVLQQKALIAELKDKDMVDTTVNGTLRLAFTAQPDAAVGTWWGNGSSPYLSAPDAALNHPVRWTKISETSGPLSSVYCFNIFDRDDVLKGGAYEMKGLFVLPEGATEGPVLTVADEGQSLSIRARVYNYSRLDMAADHKVKVQIYVQEWDATTQSFTGDAALLGTSTLDPIPGNNMANSGLNSAFATATLETGDCPLSGGCGGKYLKFWVVTWIEDSTGDLVADYQDHGLAKKPSGSFTGIGQVALEPISNNVGFWDQEIYICPKGAQCTTAAASPAPGALSLDAVSLSADQVNTFESVDVSAHLSTGNEGVGGILLLFFDGDPEAGGALFEVEHLPFIPAGGSYLSRVRYQAPVEGPRDIHVVARSGGLVATQMASLEAFEPLVAAPMCQNPLGGATEVSGSAGEVGPGDRPTSLQLHATLSDIGPLDLGNAVVTLDRLLHEVGGKGELVTQESGAGLLPLTLAAAPGSNARFARFDTGPGTTPRVRLNLRRRGSGEVDLFLQARGVALPEAPALCSGQPLTTTLSTRLAEIDDGLNPVAQAAVTGTWECETDRSGAVRDLRVVRGM